MSNDTTLLDNPPSYDAVEYDTGKGQPEEDVKPPQTHMQPPNQPYMTVGPSHVPQTGPQNPVVYHYVNPATGDRVASLLPPNHPEMICLQSGEHVPQTKYGLLGILAAVFWFPLGIGLCLLDRRVWCSRCGTVINDSLCG
ncbi:uncharacterized protein BT62DRAFT_124448 [Guyanagaster necrorhizus]|uniref:Brain protein I3 n=1 Tax=Guyanagaster necrorhizus TaxID=856835 RepID=A0A9P8AU43_9AGAR|nr:uncharacterized protein BT62DRAFT_124448 [Guyanagaster necrorhizus MCA 3950]KAG7446527.1 hypothetical protein BT62DRAFT_124448 [Guyanagaster necrorhizus MCA 3950]